MTGVLVCLFGLASVEGEPVPRDPAMPKVLRGHTRPILSFAMSSNGHLMASGDGYADQAGLVILWELPSGKKRAMLRGGKDGALDLAFSPNAKLLAAAWGKSVILWDTASGREVTRIPGFPTTTGVRFLNDKLLAVTTPGRLPRYFEVSPAVKAVKWPPLKGIHSGSVVEFSPQTRLVAVANNDLATPLKNGEVRLFDVKTGSEIAVFPAANSEVRSLAFSPDGKYLATGTADRLIRVWDLRAKRVIALRGHEEQVVALAFSPKGATLASASYDGAVKLWDLKAKSELRSFAGHRHTVFGLGFTPDGRTLVTAGFDKTVKLWLIRKKD